MGYSPWGCKRVRRLSNSTTTINSSITYNEVHRSECYLIMASDTWIHVSRKDVTMTQMEVGTAQQPAGSLWVMVTSLRDTCIHVSEAMMR